MSRVRTLRSAIAVLFLTFTLISVIFPINGMEGSNGFKEIEIDDQRIKGSFPSVSPDDLQRGFTQNNGQWPEGIRFMASTRAGNVFFHDRGMIYQLIDDTGSTSVHFDLVEADPARPEGSERSQQVSNYFLGRDPQGWISNSENFDRIVYRDVWSGIDIEYSLMDGNIKYDLKLDISADPDIISIRVAGSDKIDLKNGNLLISLPSGDTLMERPPFANYQDGEENKVSFRSIGEDRYGFKIEGKTDRPLVISPIIECMRVTASRGAFIKRMAFDGVGNIVVCGGTVSPEFPNTTGAYDTTYQGYDVFVMKFTSDLSTLIWSTFIGGWSMDIAKGLAIDENDTIYIAGTTYSPNFPTTDGVYQEDIRSGPVAVDAFVVKLSSNASSLIYSTFFGGSAVEEGNALGVYHGRAYVTGWTHSHDFPIVTHGSPFVHGTAYLSIFNENGTDMISTYFWDGYHNEWGSEIIVDRSGDAIVGGWTSSSDFPYTHLSFQSPGPQFTSNIFISKVSPFQSMYKYSCVFGSDGGSTLKGMTLDNDENVVFTGSTRSSGTQWYPLTENAINRSTMDTTDLFITKLSRNSTQLIYSAIIGGGENETGEDVVLDPTGNPYILGSGQSPDMPVTDGAFDRTMNGTDDQILMKLNSNATELLYCSYFGGSAIDTGGRVLLKDTNMITFFGETGSPDLPLTNRTFSTNSSSDGGFHITTISIKTIPSEPIDLSVTEGEGSILVDWKPPVDKGGLDIVNYTIYRGINKNSLSRLCKIGRSESYIDMNSSVGIPYYYAVSAWNEIGEGPLSDIGSNISTILPGKPRDIHVDVDLREISISFTEPFLNGGIPIINYSIFRDGALYGNCSGNDTSFLDEDISPGRTYEYSVSSWNRRGEGPRSEGMIARAKIEPSAPENLTCLPLSDRMILSWEPPVDHGELDILNYFLIKGYSSGNKSMVLSIPMDVFRYEDEKVNRGVDYFYHIIAVNEFGSSIPSNEVNSILLSHPGDPNDLSAESSLSSIELRWSEPLNRDRFPVDGYRIYHGISVDRLSVIADVEGNLTSFTHENPEIGVMNYYQVVSYNEYGSSGRSNIAFAQILGPPSPPTEVKATGVPRGVSVTWQIPDSSGLSPVTGYMVERWNSSDQTFSYISFPNDATAFNDMGVERNIIYIYRVLAMNIGGNSSFSPSVQAMGYFEPDPPADISLELDGPTVNIKWEEPEFDGGLPIKWFLIYRIVDNGAAVKVRTVEGSQRESYDIPPYDAEDVSYFMVAANDIGSSTESAIVDIVFPEPPSVPLDLKIEVRSGNVLIKWNRPESTGGSDLLGYIIYRFVNGSAEILLGSPGPNDMSFIDTSIQDGIDYRYRITARNSAGEGESTEYSSTGPIVLDNGKENGKGAGAYHLETILLILLIILIVILVVQVILKKKDHYNFDEFEE